MKLDCPDCCAIGSVYWFVAVPAIWRCDACGVLLEPKEVQISNPLSQISQDFQAVCPIEALQ